MRSSIPPSSFKTSTAPSALASSTVQRPFRSTIPGEKRFKIENLFKFERGKADLLFSLIVLMFAGLILLSFNKQSMWDHREIPGHDTADYSFADYMIYQAQNAVHMSVQAAGAMSRGEPLGEKARKRSDPKLDPIQRLEWPYEGRAPRFGKVLFKAPWLMPLFFVVLLIPAAIFNLWNSWTAARKKAKQQRPNLTLYELSYWARALEYVAYFIAYTLAVPYLGYLVTTLVFIPALAYRQGYRSARWMLIAVVCALAIVLVFRTGLQIKTPNTIWLYDFLPTSARAFMLTYF